MLRRIAPLLALSALAGCATTPATLGPRVPVEVQILAINDFHGNIETPPDPVKVTQPDGSVVTARMGGAAQLASALQRARAGHANTITVAAGDLIGASPLASAYFLDEPTIDAMNMLGLSLASVGNHEFDKGSAELLRMQAGGCGKNTSRKPCRLEPFAGARFQYLAGNVLRDDGSTLFPGDRDPPGRPDQDRLHRRNPQGDGTGRHSGRSRWPPLRRRGSDRKRACAQAQGGRRGCHRPPHSSGRQAPRGLCRTRLQRPVRRHPADPRQARPGDHHRHLRPYARSLRLRDPEGRRDPPADQRREVRLSLHRRPAGPSIRRPTS